MPRSRLNVDRATRALNNRIAGRKVSKADAAALARVEASLQLKRPGGLASYAPRTRRRYLAAAKANQTATQANKSEYRRFKGTDAKIEELRQIIVNSTLEDKQYHSAAAIDDLKETYGVQYTYTVLRNQIDSMNAYCEGNKGPGNARWLEQGQLEMRYSKDMELGSPTQPYYFYHGCLK